MQPERNIKRHGYREMDEHRIHQIFTISVILKGIHALIECIGGIALYLVSTRTIVDWVNKLTQEELIQDPHDLIANWLRSTAHHLSVGTTAFYSAYLLSHGLVKILLVAGLLRNKLWAYPVSLLVLIAFIAYQLYRYAYTHSIGLLLLTFFDVFIILLIGHEWRILRDRLRQA